MKAIFMRSDGSFKSGVSVSVFPKTGKYQLTIPGRWVPLRGDVGVEETPTGMELRDGFTVDFSGRGPKIIPDNGGDWSANRTLISGRIYGPRGTFLSLEVGEKSQILAVSYGWNQRGDQRQFCDFVLLLREGDEAVVTAVPRKNKEAKKTVVATIFVGDDGELVRIQGARPESDMARAIKEVSASFA